MRDCSCCGQHTYDARELCDACANGCDPSESWHCFTGHCEGSGCTYLGECEGYASDIEYLEAQFIKDHPELANDYDATLYGFAKTAVGAIPCDGCQRTVSTCECGKDDRAYWDDRYA